MEGNRVHATVWHFARGPGTDSVLFYFTEGIGLWLLTWIAFFLKASQSSGLGDACPAHQPTSLLDTQRENRSAFYLHVFNYFCLVSQKLGSGLRQ